MEIFGHFELEQTDYGWRIMARDETAERAESTLRATLQNFQLAQPSAVVIEQTEPWQFEARAFISRPQPAQLA